MPPSVWDTEVQITLEQASKQEARLVYVGNRDVEVLTPFPSPIDWRDSGIYFMMVDRFKNPAAPPHHQPRDQPWGDYQGSIPDQKRSVKEMVPCSTEPNVGDLGAPRQSSADSA